MKIGIYEQIINRLFEEKICWNMVEPIPGSVMHFARMKEIA